MKIEEKNGVVLIDGFDVMKHIEKLEMALNCETNRNRKAIEYIKNHIDSELQKLYYAELLGILGGVEKDENN